MKKAILIILWACIVGSAISCDEWPAPWAIIVDESGNPISKAKAQCDAPDEDLPVRFSDDNGKIVAPYMRGDVKCIISKDGYEPVATVFILRRPRKFSDPELITLKKL